MYRIDNSTAATILPAPGPPGTPGFFSTGTVGGELATIVSADFMNQVQEELIAVVTAGGFALDKTDNSQVIQAILALIANNTRRRLTAPLDLWCAPGGSDTNNGLTPETPFATPTAAYNLLVQQYDLGGQTVTIHLADGVYSGVTLAGPLVGQMGASSLVFLGNPANPANVQVNQQTGEGGCFEMNFFSACTLNGMQVSSALAQGVCIGAVFGSTVFVENLIYGACGGYHNTAQWGSSIYPVGPYTIAGGAQCHIFAYNGGRVAGELAGAVTVTLVGTPHFSQAFVNASNNSFIEYDSTAITWSGAATGYRFSVNNHSGIYVPGGGLNYLPGDTPGVADAATFGLYAA